MISHRRVPLQILATIVFVLFNLVANAQPDTVKIRTVIDQLFTGMRTGDSSLVSQSFMVDATLQSISTTPDGKVNLRKDAIAGFVKAVGTPHKEVWNEHIYNLKIQIDGPLATVWAPYKFHLDEKFSHCGVNVLILIKTENGWKIASITDTRRKDACQ
jgi:hypothetical protein